MERSDGVCVSAGDHQLIDLFIHGVWVGYVIPPLRTSIVTCIAFYHYLYYHLSPIITHIGILLHTFPKT